ncbi:MAG: GDYXXLXY domain-containing protein [Actinomycetota bacterium]
MTSTRFWVPLLFQLALIISIPAQAVYTYFTGKTVVLQTAPVDPYDFLRGYSQTLSYDISSQGTLKQIPGWKDSSAVSGSSFYVILAAPTEVATSSRPQPWKPVQISFERPTHLPANQVALKGKYNGWRMEYGLETYYMPEDQREQINADIQSVQRRQQQAFVVEVKVDANGNAIPVSLWVRDRNYRF